MNRIVLWLFLLTGFTVCAQKQGNEIVDSLLRQLKNLPPDTNRVNVLNELSYAYYAVSPDLAVSTGKEAIALALKLKFNAGLAKAYRVTGSGHIGLSDYKPAMYYYQKALDIESSLHNKKGMGSNLMNIGLVYTYQSAYGKALEYFFKALKIFEEIKFEKGKAFCYGNIVLVYMETAQYDKGLEFAKKALELDRSTGNESGQARHLGNMGTIYMSLSQPAKAMTYMQEALTIFKKIQDMRGMANTLGNMGGCYVKMKQFDKALECIKVSLKDFEAMNSSKDVANNLLNIGNVYFEMAVENYQSVSGLSYNGKLKEALDYAVKAETLSRGTHELALERDAKFLQYKVYKKLSDKSKALALYEQFITLRDSIYGQENKKDLIRKEMLFEFEKKQVADSIHNANEKEINRAQIAAQKARLQEEVTRRYALIIGIILLIVFTFIVYTRLRLTRRQKNIIEKQKNLVELQRTNILAQKKVLEEKNKEIYDSILYAKRLQEAILPSNKLLNRYLKDSYVFYKPKDIVAGDFYWLETFPRDDQGNYYHLADFSGNPSDYILFAVADCTGHGVPGAMVSIFCSNALNRAVKEFFLVDPGKILDKVRELVIETFEKSEMEVRDGMDISLCLLNFKTFELKWSGANNPLWLVRNNDMKEFRPDRQPIGKYENPRRFTTHTIPLQKGDKFYIFTDGLADQFGGEKGKKLKTGKLRELIMAQQSNSMQVQYDIMDKFFEMWKGELEQVDDICVIGVSI